MELKPLAPTINNGACLNAKIACLGCQASTSYASAFHAGWTYNPAGLAFVDYYCPVCTKRIESNS